MSPESLVENRNQCQHCEPGESDDDLERQNRARRERFSAIEHRPETGARERKDEIEIEQVPDVNLGELNKIMQQYGFDDYFAVGDIIGTTLGGYKTDELTTPTAVRWLRAGPPRCALAAHAGLLSELHRRLRPARGEDSAGAR